MLEAKPKIRHTCHVLAQNVSWQMMYTPQWPPRLSCGSQKSHASVSRTQPCQYNHLHISGSYSTALYDVIRGPFPAYFKPPQHDYFSWAIFVAFSCIFHAWNSQKGCCLLWTFAKAIQSSGMLRRPRDPVVPWSERVVILLSTDKVIASVVPSMDMPGQVLEESWQDWHWDPVRQNGEWQDLNEFWTSLNQTETVWNWGAELKRWPRAQNSPLTQMNTKMAWQWQLRTLAAHFLPMHIMHFVVIQCDPVRPRERHLLQISRPSKDASMNATTRSRGCGCRIQMFLEFLRFFLADGWERKKLETCLIYFNVV
jgi:hypothetical protein